MSIVNSFLTLSFPLRNQATLKSVIEFDEFIWDSCGIK